MIFSRTWSFAFIKNQKVGGTSVEIALAPHCGPADIITPITPVDEAKRLASGGGCRNFTRDPGLERRYLAAIARGATGQRPQQLDAATVIGNHASWAELAALVGDELSGVVTFAVERHPYEKALSLAGMLADYPAVLAGHTPSLDADTLRATLDQLIADGRIKQIVNYPRYVSQGRVAVDRLIEHGRLTEGLAEMAERLGLPQPITLPRAKETRGPGGEPAAAILTAAQCAYIKDLCGPEFRIMGYQD